MTHFGVVGPSEIIADVLLAVYASETARREPCAREAAVQVADKLINVLAAEGWRLSKDDLAMLERGR